MKIRALVLITTIVFLVSCKSEILPKPKAHLSLEYADNKYHRVINDCPYSLEISLYSTIVFENNCWAKVHYPKLNATIHLTYRRIDNDLIKVLKEVEKLTYEHAVKADAISSRPYENDSKRVFGKVVNVEGNVASNIQFHMTDSIKNVLYGTLYFNVNPNYDSIRPALNYIEKDIVNLIETIEWKN